MKCRKLVQGLGLSLTCVGLALPSSTLAAQPAVASQRMVAAPTSLDVALREGGVLAGQVVSPQGVAMADALVTIWHQNKAVATTKTDATGHFTVSGLREGTHFIEAGGQVIHCRFWQAVSAPPAAHAQVLLVGNTKVTRGQSNDDDHNALMWGVIGAGVATGLILEKSNHHHHHHHHPESGPSSD